MSIMKNGPARKTLKQQHKSVITATQSLEHILPFSIVSNALEPIKPLVTKM